MTMILTFLLLLLLTICPFLGTEKTYHAVAQLKAPLADIRNTPVAGTVHGRRFTPDKVTLENGVLTIRQGKDFFADLEVQIFLQDLEKGAVPEGKSITITSDDGISQGIFVKWREKGKEIPEVAHTWNGYTLRLSFGKEETKGVLPGKIFLSLPGKLDTELQGHFSAQIEGYRLVNGEVDLTSDSNETLDEVALRYLKKKHPGKEISIDSQRDSFYAKLPDSRKWGHKDLSYVLEKRPTRTKLLFVKESNVWKIHQELSPNLIHQAHPVFPPNPTEHSDIISFAVAQRAEKDVNAEFPGKSVHGTDIDYGYDNMSGFATVDFSFKINDFQKPMTKRYLLRLVGEYDWEVSRELGPNEQVNLQTGRSE